MAAAPPNTSPAPGADASPAARGNAARGNASPPKSGNVFTRKLGPLPAWAWMAIAAAIVLLIVVYEYRKNSASSSTAADTTPETINQTYPPESEPSTDSDSGSGSGTGPPDPAHPRAFKIKPGESPPTTRHGKRTWVHGHVGPKGAYHKGHWSGAGKHGGGVPQPGKPAAKASGRTPAAHHRHKARA